MGKQRIETRTLTGLSILTAIVFVLQLLGSFIRLGTFSVSLVLIPIVIGAAMYGVGAGAWLGFVFGVAVLLSGDAAFFMSFNWFGAILTVLLKGILAGVCAGLVYKALEKKNRTLAVFAAAVAAPLANTAVFILGCLLFFMPKIAELGGEAVNPYLFLFIGIIGLNFFFELGLNIILAPTIHRLVSLGSKDKKTEAPVRKKYSMQAVRDMAVGLFLTLGNKLLGSLFFELYAAVRRYDVIRDGGEIPYLMQPIFDINTAEPVYASVFMNVFAAVGALLIAVGVVRFFTHLNEEPSEQK